MKSFVITLMKVPESVKMAERCIESAANHGITVSMFEAVTPEEGMALARKHDINIKAFDEKYSRLENCVAAFMSHFLLWKEAINQKQDILIFEHDAVVTAPFPFIPAHNGVVTLGMPSYGNYNSAPQMGLQRMFSKRYLPGAHAYVVSPDGARTITHQATVKAGPTDVYLNMDTFSWIQEYYPWIAEARDTFSTIQNDNGIQAKHAYKKLGEKYKLI